MSHPHFSRFPPFMSGGGSEKEDFKKHNNQQSKHNKYMTESDNSPGKTTVIVQTSINRLKYLCDIIPPLLENVSGEEFAIKHNPGKWSKKEILGHLIDSAANNHHRFIRGQFEDTPHIIYDQDKWNICSSYNTIDSQHLIDFWEAYNRQIIFIINAIPKKALKRKCRTNETEPVTIEWLIEDYVRHLEHHLKQLVKYE